MVMVARADFPAGTLAELVDFVRKRKDAVSMGHAGVGAASHLCEMLFMSTIDTELTMVAYRGTAPAMTDLLGGQIQLICDQATSAISNIKAGKVKAYTVTTPARLASLPDVPTTLEAGLAALQVSVWHGLYAPKGTPRPVIDRLVMALQAALEDPALKERFADLATEPGHQGACDAQGARGPSQSRNGQMGADHQEGRCLRGVTASLIRVDAVH
jgi:tripartite-type tricarboxylate transporter receptor subunit TctC